MQREITTPGKLLDSNGNLVEKGYARSLIKEYDRKDVKAPNWRIKEWDYYLIYDENYAIALTLDDNTYMGLRSVSVIDFKNKRELTLSPMSFFTGGKTNLPKSSKKGDVSYKDKKVEMDFSHIEGGRKLVCRMPNYYKKDEFYCELSLTDEPADSMVILTPFDKKKHFYYNQKIVGFKVEGYFKVGQFTYNFNKNTSRGILDWGRGVWTYKNTWYWGAGCGTIDGHEVGFNIGYGFGNTEYATENVVFYDGVLHKLEHVEFNIPKNEMGKYLYEDKWTFTSSDKRFEMEFEPIIDRHSDTNVILIGSFQHQVFGKFSGRLILDDGTQIELKDFIGFAERVYNKW